MITKQEHAPEDLPIAWELSQTANQWKRKYLRLKDQWRQQSAKTHALANLECTIWSELDPCEAQELHEEWEQSRRDELLLEVDTREAFAEYLKWAVRGYGNQMVRIMGTYRLTEEEKALPLKDRLKVPNKQIDACRHALERAQRKNQEKLHAARTALEKLRVPCYQREVLAES